MVNAYYPQTIEEALKLKSAMKNNAVLIMGGSDLMVRGSKAENMIFLNSISELRQTKCTENELIIGAGCTYCELIENDDVPDILRSIMMEIASPAVRNAGTVVGNICNASPAGDMLPVLYAMDAVIVAASFASEQSIVTRRIPVEDFIIGVRKTSLGSDEIVTAVEIPRSSYEGMTKLEHTKVGARKAEAISKLSFVGLMKIEQNTIADIRIAFGAVGTTVIRERKIEKDMIGKTVEEIIGNKDVITDSYDKLLHPIDDQRSTAQYRKKVCRNLLCDFLECR